MLSSNEFSQEMIVMGRGIAFQKKQGEQIEGSLIEKTFILTGEGPNFQLAHLFQKLDSEEIELAKEIIMLAESQLEREFSDTIYLTFTDHLHYTLERAREEVFLPNPLLFEIKRFYQKEFQVALAALQLIEQRYGLVFPESEAGFITLHFVNHTATYEGMAITMTTTEIVRDVLSIISKFFGMLFAENSLSYTRMVTHLQYFVQRILTDVVYEDSDEFLYELVQSKYPEAFQCSLRIKNYLKTTRNLNVNESEMIYLVIHINRVVQEAAKKK